MVDSIGGSQNPYWNQRSGNIPPRFSSANVQNSSDEVKGSSSPISYILNGDPDKRPAAAKPENHEGPVGGFIEGLKNGLTSMVKGMFTVNGVLTMVGCAALIAATGGAATPFLIAAGVGAGGYQMGKGLLKGDWEEMGRGAFMAGTSVLGAKYDFAGGASKATATTSKVVSNASDALSDSSKIASNASQGENFAMALDASKNDGFEVAATKLPTITDHFKLVAGQKMIGSNGTRQSIYELIADNARHRYSQVKSWF